MKDQDEARKALAALWGGNAEFYGTKLTAIQLKLFVEKTEHLGPRLVKKDLDNLQMNPNQKFMPRPNDVLGEIQRGMALPTSEDAIEMAQKIWDVAAEFGHYVNPKQYEKRSDQAKRRLDCDSTWDFIQRRGGWGTIVNSIKEASYNFTTWCAQVRDALKASIKKTNQKILDKISGNESLNLEEFNNLGLGEFSPKLIV